MTSGPLQGARVAVLTETEFIPKEKVAGITEIRPGRQVVTFRDVH